MEARGYGGGGSLLGSSIPGLCAEVGATRLMARDQLSSLGRYRVRMNVRMHALDDYIDHE